MIHEFDLCNWSRKIDEGKLFDEITMWL